MAFSLVDLSDDDPRVVTIKAMVNDQGWCLASFARVEYLIGDLVWLGRDMPQYAQVAGRQFPMSLGGRQRTLRAMLATIGPFSLFREELELLLDRLNELEEPRHMFVHGFTSFISTPTGDAAMEFRTFLEPPKGGGRPARRYTGIVRPASLSHARFLWTVFAGTFVDTTRRIYSHLGLEPSDERPVM